jgi:hypothetical protein
MATRAVGLALVLATLGCGGANAPGQQAFTSANTAAAAVEAQAPGERTNPSDKVLGHLALVTGSSPATAFAVTRDLLAASDQPGVRHLQLPDGAVVDAVPVAHLTGSGLVLLRPLTPVSLDPIVLGADGEVPAVGSDVFAYAAVAHGSSVNGTRTRGVVRGITINRTGALLVETDTPIPSGGLGGPLVDAEGHVIGVAVQIGNEQRYVAASHIRRLNRTLAGSP